MSSLPARPPLLNRYVAPQAKRKTLAHNKEPSKRAKVQQHGPEQRDTTTGNMQPSEPDPDTLSAQIADTLNISGSTLDHSVDVNMMNVASTLADVAIALQPRNPLLTRWDELVEEVFGGANSSMDDLTDTEEVGEDITGHTSVRISKKPSPAMKTSEILKGFKKQSNRDIASARTQANTYHVPGFDYSKATSTSGGVRYAHLALDKAPKDVREWLDNQPRRAISSDGVDVLYYLPNTFRPASCKILTEVLTHYGRSIPLTTGTGADNAGRNALGSYVFAKGQLTGVVKLVKCWHAIGHTNEDSVISKDFIKSGQHYGQSMSLIDKLSMLSHRVNQAYDAIDPVQYQALRQLMEKAEKKYPHIKALNAIDPLHMEGRAIMFNRTTPRHTDRLDPLSAWAVLVILGNFKNGTLFIPRLSIRLKYVPGDMVFIRGRILQHEVEVWEGGQRISIAHFTHSSLWEEFEMTCP